MTFMLVAFGLQLMHQGRAAIPGANRSFAALLSISSIPGRPDCMFVLWTTSPVLMYPYRNGCTDLETSSVVCIRPRTSAGDLFLRRATDLSSASEEARPHARGLLSLIVANFSARRRFGVHQSSSRPRKCRSTPSVEASCCESTTDVCYGCRRRSLTEAGQGVSFVSSDLLTQSCSVLLLVR